TVQQGKQAFIGGGRGRFDGALGAFERLLEAIAVKGLEEIVEGVDFKGTEGELVMGGHEDDRWQRRARERERFGHAEVVQVWHLRIEEVQVGVVLLQSSNRRLAVGGLADHFDVGVLFEQRPHALARQGLVVDDERADFHARSPPGTAAPASWPAACPASWKGMVMSTCRPRSRPLVSSKRWAAP